MSDQATAVTWRAHPSSGKWHAFRDERSICRYTVHGGEPQATLPAGARVCSFCGSALRVSRSSVGRIDASEASEAEFIGGRLDGARLVLEVVHESPTVFRVLAGTYRARRGSSGKGGPMTRRRLTGHGAGPNHAANKETRPNGRVFVSGGRHDSQSAAPIDPPASHHPRLPRLVRPLPRRRGPSRRPVRGVHPHGTPKDRVTCP